DKEVEVMKPRNFSAETCPKLFNVEYSTVVGLLVKGIEYTEKYNQMQTAADNVVAEPKKTEATANPAADKTNVTQKPKPKEEKKTSRFMGWVNSTLKSLFGEDGTESKI
nr:hypothetical protein [Bacteroidales bacterium]